MGLSAARTHLQRIADWQRANGTSGAPPVSFDKCLSNWVQYCRTVARRGLLNSEVAAAFDQLGISIQRGPTSTSSSNRKAYADPRGFLPVMRAARDYLHQHAFAPSLRSDNVRVRHQAAWLMRLQAGILPANAFGWTAPLRTSSSPRRSWCSPSASNNHATSLPSGCSGALAPNAPWTDQRQATTGTKPPMCARTIGLFAGTAAWSSCQIT